MADVTLSKVNVPPAQTWNYLKINGISLEVPAVTGGEGNLPDRLTRIETGIGDAATAWIDSAVPEPRLISVPARTDLDEPILIEVESDRGELASTGVIVHEGAHATIVVVAADTERAAAGMTDERAAQSGIEAVVAEPGKAVPETDKPISASLLRISADRNAKVDVYEYVAVPTNCRHIEGAAIEADDDASIEVHQYLLGGGTVAAGLAVTQRGARSSFKLDTHYLVHENELLDMNYVARVRGRNARTRIDASGVLSDGAEKTLRDTIDLICGCKGAKGDENETVVVTGDNIVNRSLPVILCDEEDVQGNHGATIGSMSVDQLQYLRDRGLTTDEAEELFGRAVVDDAALNAPVKAARDAVLSRAAELIGDEAAADLIEIFENDQEVGE